MPDRLLHQRAQPRLAAVERPLPIAEPFLGATVPNRRMPVLARLGHAAEPSVHQAGDLDTAQHLVQPCQFDELVLVAAARPAPVHPQQVAVDGRQRQALGGVGVPLGVYSTFWLAQPRGRCTRAASPSRHTASPVRAISESQQRRSSRVVMKLPSGWQYPSAASGPRSRSMLSPISVLEMPTARPARRYDSPSRMTAPTASRRPSNGSGGVPPARVGGVGSGGPGGGPARPARGRAATNAGSMTTGPDLQAGFSTLPMVWSRSRLSTPKHHARLSWCCAFDHDVRPLGLAAVAPAVVGRSRWAARPDVRAPRPQSPSQQPRGSDPPRNQPTSYGAPVISCVTASWPTWRHAPRSGQQGTLPWQKR